MHNNTFKQLNIVVNKEKLQNAINYSFTMKNEEVMIFYCLYE